MSTSHASDCASNNEPAFPPGECDCQEECHYCRDDAVGKDALGRSACEAHIEEVADDLGYFCGANYCDDPACRQHRVRS